MSEKLDQLLTLPQYILPHHLLSKLMFYITRAPMGKLTPWLIKQFIKFFKINMEEVQHPEPENYKNFNAFFTRALKPEARPLGEGIISPVDGEISQIGQINQRNLFQAKGFEFDLLSLLGGFEPLAGLFENGQFCTIYLSPKDYHRIHAPVAGRPIDMAWVPGRLFSVNQRTARQVPNLFARNERVVTIFKTPVGPMAMIMVGAIFVGSMDMVWQDGIAPGSGKTPQRWQVPDTMGQFDKGAEVGRFNMGSTVILLFSKNQMQWLAHRKPGDVLKMGESLGKY
ncbi:archaetidylserine decarboxylase [Candidatus Venteria ishoeyi]|uniref:archaetidylserine decarboxylase n=1 Tax=Candidatus Venteria ishoeyi TaxID=1899563 RepID=UPI0025A586DD|nr:archaetidylserine decarboxylase [Candidatus Venteria ishoeyi]MDM8547768.1 archaetidylserine decarboxylase [Candidatus Venteria ishoeyi]